MARELRGYSVRAWILLIIIGFIFQSALAQGDLSSTKANGYRGIWFTLGQYYDYGDKYSGGLGTYTAKHMPLAIYAPAAEKTFFVYGGTTREEDRHLLCMIGSFDHRDSTVARPTIVYDKQGVDDPHDNPSLLIDADGYLWVFVSGRNTRRPGFKFKSTKPYSIERFEQITEENMTYPQAWYLEGRGFFHFFTKYTGVRELYYETSEDGRIWTDDQKLASIIGGGETKSGHYQVSGHRGDTVGTFFSRHPDGDPDRRTNLYYLQTTDFGRTWTTADGTPVDLPVSNVASPTRVIDYESGGKNVYLKDMDFDARGYPACLYLISNGHEPGPDNGPREWRITYYSNDGWQTETITTSDHNYDTGSLWLTDSAWTVIAPTANGPQPPGGGGEVVQWVSRDHGNSWTATQVTSGSPRNHNYVRRVVNGRAPFEYFWADGNPNELSRSALYFGNQAGQYWQLPYEMEQDKAKSIPMSQP